MEFILDLLVDLICEAIDIICTIFIIPDYRVKKVTDISGRLLNDLKFSRQVKGLIIDVDETIRFNGGKVSGEYDAWIDTMLSNFKVIVISNGYDEYIINYFKEKNVEVISCACKPLQKYFKVAKEKLDLKSNEIMVIGDNTFTDVLGAKISRMLSCKVKDKKKKKWYAYGISFFNLFIFFFLHFLYIFIHIFSIWQKTASLI